MARSILELALTLLGLCLSVASAQRLPFNGCDSVFHYQRWNEQWIGHVKPQQDGLRNVHWKLIFSQHGVNEAGDISSLMPYPNKETALQRMQDGGRGEIYVRFDNYHSELPKIVRIELNGQLLCNAEEYGAPSTTKTRELSMSVSGSSTRQQPMPALQASSSISLVNRPPEKKPAAAATSHKRCNDVFEYRLDGDHWIGLVTPPEAGLTDISWTVKFSARGVDKPGKTSAFSAYPNKQAAFEVMRNGGRPQSYLRFDDYVGEVPRLSQVELNGKILCSYVEYDAPSTTSTRQYQIALGSSGTQVQSQTRPETTTRAPVVISQRKPSNANNPFLSGLITTTKRPERVTFTQQTSGLEQCGQEGLVGLQVGGETVPRGRFPWLAALYYDSNPDALKVDLVYKCVTTLVSARTVMTAAHCIYGVLPNDLRVYVGRHDVTLHPEQHATLMLVQSVHTQPDFVGNLVPDSDVGLLVLTERVQYSIYVRPICMWSSSSSVSIGDSEQTAVAGWGTDATFKPTRYPVTVNVRPVSREECLREMITARDFLTPRTICAGNDQGHGPCLGDSGGGLMVLRNNRWFLRGIVSVAQRAGLGCDLSRYVIYCDVARHLSWIERTIVS
ncbi:uncharacterized protein LOC108601868 [Drosophila busckii]|nr:uncharacterized protein LOC108601868 [Drosophila busckii]